MKPFRELLSRFKELAAFINDILRNFLAVVFGVPFKPCASTKKGSTREVIIFIVPTIGLLHFTISIISFHTYLIKKIPMRMCAEHRGLPIHHIWKLFNLVKHVP